MESWGNERAKQYWEARLPRDYAIPSETDSMYTLERWIRDKYERKLFVGQINPSESEQSAQDEPQSSQKSSGDRKPTKKTKAKSSKPVKMVIYLCLLML